MRPIPRFAHPSNAGAASRPLLLILALVFVSLGLAVWLLCRPSEESSALERSSIKQAAVAPDPSAGGDLSLREDAQALAAGTRGEGLREGVGVGVRLAGPGRLTGFVIERESGAGVRGARVELLALPPIGAGFLGRVLDLAGLGTEVSRRTLPVAVAASGEGGRFEFEGVREGRYFIDVQSDYHLPEAPGRARVLASGAGGPVEIFVRSGGRVVGELLRDERPMAGALVTLEPGPGLVVESARTGALRLLEARTDGHGRFAFAGVAPGMGYEVSAIGGGFALTHAIDIEVRAGEDTELRIEARAGGAIEGRVLSLALSEDGEELESPVPLAGAQVGVVPRGLRDLRFIDEMLARYSATTDVDGRYRFEHAPPGEVDVIAVAALHLPGLSRAVRVAEGGKSAAEDIELFTAPLVNGRVVDPEGEPIPGVRLRWNTFDRGSIGRRGLEISFAPFLAQAVGDFEYPVTDTDGRFAAGPFPGDPPHRIEFYKAGYRDTRHRYEPSEQEGEIEVVMHRGGALEGIVMDLERAQPVTQFRVSTRDRIETNIEAPGRMNPFAGGSIFEDPGGRFRLGSVEAGKISITVRALGYLPTHLDDIEIVEGETTRGVIVKLVPGGTVSGQVVDEEGGPIPGAQVVALAPKGRGFGGRRGRRDREGRRSNFVREMPPAVLAYATSLGLIGDSAVRTDREGKFELVGVESGPSILTAFHPDFVPGASGTVEISADEPTEDVRIELSAGGGVYGKVEDRHGRALAGTAVIAVAPTRFWRGGSSNVGGGLYQGAADEDGEYRIEHMSGGSYFLLATRGDEALNPLSFLSSFDFDVVTVPHDELIRFDIVDEAAGGTRVFGFVTDRGDPVAGGSLAAIGYESDNLLGVDFKLARVRPSGEYEFEGLAPGEYQLELDAAGTRVRLLIDVPDVPEYRLDLEVPESGIEGRVLEEGTGTPVARAQVFLRPLDRIEPEGILAALIQSEGQLLRERTDAEGMFQFERLQAGGYELFVRPRAREGQPSLAPSEPIEIELAHDELHDGLEIQLRPAFAIRGVVLGPDGAPLEGARVRADRTDELGLRAAREETDEEGRFTLSSLGPGEYSVHASAEGYAESHLAGVELGEEEAVEVELQLETGLEVELVVYAADGRTLSGARARLEARGGAGRSSPDLSNSFRRLLDGGGATDGDGRLELGRFLPGEYELTVWRGLSRITEPDISLEPGAGRVQLTVSLP